MRKGFLDELHVLLKEARAAAEDLRMAPEGSYKKKNVNTAISKAKQLQDLISYVMLSNPTPEILIRDIELLNKKIETKEEDYSTWADSKHTKTPTRSQFETESGIKEMKTQRDNLSYLLFLHETSNSNTGDK